MKSLLNGLLITMTWHENKILILYMTDLQLITNNGYTYYEIAPDTVLYRGDTDLYPSFTLPNTHLFFSDEKKFVSHYGLVFRFLTTKTLRLIALDQPNDKLYNEAPAVIQTILRNQYGFKSDTPLRDTSFNEDKKVVEYICSLPDTPFDGYAIDRMDVPSDAYVDPYEGEEDLDNRKFHREFAICRANENLVFMNAQEDISQYTNQEIEDARLKRLAIKQKYEMSDTRRRKKSRSRDSLLDSLSRTSSTSLFTGNSSLDDNRMNVNEPRSPGQTAQYWDTDGYSSNNTIPVTSFDSPVTVNRGLTFNSGDELSPQSPIVPTRHSSMQDAFNQAFDNIDIEQSPKKKPRSLAGGKKYTKKKQQKKYKKKKTQMKKRLTKKNHKKHTMRKRRKKHSQSKKR